MKNRHIYPVFGPLRQTALMMAGMLLLMTLSRLCLYFFNAGSFQLDSFRAFAKIFLGGLRFDVAALFMLNGFFLLLNVFPVPFRERQSLRITRGIVFVLPNAIALAANLIDSVYFRFTMKRMTGDIFSYLGAGGKDALRLLPQFLADFWFVFALWILCLFLLIALFVSLSSPLSGRITLGNYLRQLLVFILVAGLSVIAMRGGFQLKPVNIISAGQYADPRNVPLVLNTPFTIIKTLDQDKLELPDFYPSRESLASVFTPVHGEGAGHAIRGDSLPVRNVVILILESFSLEHISAMDPFGEGAAGPSFTPFLDSLCGEALWYRAYANGKRSIEGIPAVVASLPSLMNNDFITSVYAGNRITSLASLLREKGFQTAFYHGGNNGTMNFDDFARVAGYEKYYGRNEYGDDKDYDGLWGIYDEPYLQYFARSLKATPQPFFATIFTLSSHHPYPIPAAYKGRFPKGKLPIEESIAYTDFSLRQFFRTASSMPWFEHTLFVLTADHTSEADHPFYRTRSGMYSIPLIFYHKGSNLKGQGRGTIQQLDVMPTVLDFLQYDKPFVAFGRSVFDTTRPEYAVSYLDGTYLFIQGDYALVSEGKKAQDLYDLGKDPLQENNLRKLQSRKMNEMNSLLQAVIQQYNERMIENRLTDTLD